MEDEFLEQFGQFQAGKSSAKEKTPHKEAEKQNSFLKTYGGYRPDIGKEEREIEKYGERASRGFKTSEGILPKMLKQIPGYEEAAETASGYTEKGLKIFGQGLLGRGAGGFGIPGSIIDIPLSILDQAGDAVHRPIPGIKTLREWNPSSHNLMKRIDMLSGGKTSPEGEWEGAARTVGELFGAGKAAPESKAPTVQQQTTRGLTQLARQQNIRHAAERTRLMKTYGFDKQTAHVLAMDPSQIRQFYHGMDEAAVGHIQKAAQEMSQVIENEMATGIPGYLPGAGSAGMEKSAGQLYQAVRSQLGSPANATVDVGDQLLPILQKAEKEIASRFGEGHEALPFLRQQIAKIEQYGQRLGDIMEVKSRYNTARFASTGESRSVMEPIRSEIDNIVLTHGGQGAKEAMNAADKIYAQRHALDSILQARDKFLGPVHQDYKGFRDWLMKNRNVKAADLPQGTYDRVLDLTDAGSRLKHTANRLVGKSSPAIEELGISASAPKGEQIMFANDSTKMIETWSKKYGFDFLTRGLKKWQTRLLFDPDAVAIQTRLMTQLGKGKWKAAVVTGNILDKMIKRWDENSPDQSMQATP